MDCIGHMHKFDFLQSTNMYEDLVLELSRESRLKGSASGKQDRQCAVQLLDATLLKSSRQLALLTGQ